MSQLFLQGLKDQRLQSGLITITEVDLSGDLQHCKIFVSIYANESKQRDEILNALSDAKGFLKGELTRRLQMRRVPEIVFKLDRGVEKGNSVLDLLGKLEEERKEKNQIRDSLDAE